VNKKGTTLLLWIEIVILIGFFLGVMAIIGSDMNAKYEKNYDLTIGLNLTEQISDLAVYKSDIINDTSGGQTSMTDYGILKLLTTPKILLQAAGIIWDVVNGSFIYSIISSAGLGAYGFPLAVALQILFVVSIGFIILRLVLRIPI